MEQRISLITLGVADVSRARTFYEQLGWRGQEVEETVFFQAGAIALMRHSQLSARQIVEESLRIAGRICIYTNDQISIEEL